MTTKGAARQGPHGQSNARDVDAYLAEVPEQRREGLSRLGELCPAKLTGFHERMAYGLPSYARDSVAEIAFANQKQSMSFYLRRSDLRATFDQRLQGYDMGKGCLRFRRPETIDFNLVQDLLHATAAKPGAIC